MIGLARCAFAADSEAAAKLYPVELPGIPPAKAAPWTALASALLNLDAFITRE